MSPGKNSSLASLGSGCFSTRCDPRLIAHRSHLESALESLSCRPAGPMAPARAALPCSPQDAEPQSGVPGLRLTGSAGWAQTVPVTYQLYSLGQGAHLLGSPNPTWKRGAGHQADVQHIPEWGEPGRTQTLQNTDLEHSCPLCHLHLCGNSASTVLIHTAAPASCRPPGWDRAAHLRLMCHLVNQ